MGYASVHGGSEVTKHDIIRAYEEPEQPPIEEAKPTASFLFSVAKTPHTSKTFLTASNQRSPTRSAFKHKQPRHRRAVAFTSATRHPAALAQAEQKAAYWQIWPFVKNGWKGILVALVIGACIAYS